MSSRKYVLHEIIQTYPWSFFSLSGTVLGISTAWGWAGSIILQMGQNALLAGTLAFVLLPVTAERGGLTKWSSGGEAIELFSACSPHLQRWNSLPIKGMKCIQIQTKSFLSRCLLTFLAAFRKGRENRIW